MVNDMLIELLSRGEFWDFDRKFALNTTLISAALVGKTWVQYNPAKPIKRYGIPLTVDVDHPEGTYPHTGLTSLRDLMWANTVGVDVERKFSTFTDLARQIGFDKWWYSIFPPDSAPARSHFIKLDSGGFFPPHRDGNFTIDTDEDCFRLFCPIKNCDSRSMVWLQNGRQLTFDHGRVYFINTYVEHSVYSFVDDCVFLVINVPNKYAKSAMRGLAVK